MNSGLPWYGFCDLIMTNSCFTHNDVTYDVRNTLYCGFIEMKDNTDAFITRDKIRLTFFKLSPDLLPSNAKFDTETYKSSSHDRHVISKITHFIKII